jgi:zinc protease
VADFFRTFYIPNNAVLTLAGDLDPKGALALVERYFGDIPSGPPTPPLYGTPEIPPVIGGTVRTEVVGEVPLTRLYMAGRFPAADSPDFQVAEVAATVLGSGKASRLYRSLVREKKIAKDVLSYVFPLQTGASMYLFWVTGYAGAEPKVLEEALLREVEALGSVTQKELDRAVALTETHLLQEIQHVGDRADLLSMFDQLFDDPDRLNGEIERVRSVTRDQVRDFAERYLGSDNRAFLTYIPGGAS